MCLNPFEVREVLQDIAELELSKSDGLNPFEVREVLQAPLFPRWCNRRVSIPLKSGRCCKSALQHYFFKINVLFVNLC